MKIFVISLKDSVNRHTAITKKMQELDLEFDFFYAIDCRNKIPNKFIKKINFNNISKTIGRNISNSEVGCALSHAFVYEKIVNENIQHTIILEDDVILNNYFQKIVKQKTMEKCKHKFILLYHFKCRVIKVRMMEFFEKYKIGKVINQASSTAGYYINYEMACLLNNKTKIITYLADWAIDISIEDAYAVVPRIVKHPSLVDSTIEKTRLQTTKIKKQYFIFGRFGFVSWIIYKFKKPFSITVSEQIEGE